MKRVILTLLVIFAATSIVHSQTILRGKVTDTSTGKAVEFASVSVKGKNSNFFDGATTDAQGYYTVGNLPNDTLSISVSCTGYEEHIKIIVCHGNNETINIDFAINNAVTNLGEVSVEAMRSQMRMELDKKVFDVSASTIAEGASVADILNDIPSVELTAEGTISLRGSESVIIWINGKPSGLDAENQTQILEQLPAESIERVEVITNPSSKYSPEGTAGIINIVLKEKRKAGYYGSIQAGINSRLGYNASGNIFYSNNKIDLFGSLGYSSRVMTSENTTSRKTVVGGSDTGYLNSVGNTRGRGHNIFTRLGGTYHLTSRDDISLSAFGMFGKQRNNTDVEQSSNIGKLLSGNRNTSGANKMLGGNVSLGYHHTFSDRQNIDISADYNVWNMMGSSVISETTLFDTNHDNTADSTAHLYENQTMDIINKSLNIKADYVNVIDANQKIEAGYNGTFGRENAPTQTYSGQTPNNLTLNTSLSNTYLYDKFVNALYMTYSGQFGRFNYQAGLRGEYTHIGMQSTGYSTINKDYFDLFPSLFVNYTLPADNQLQLNYTRRIKRPDGRKLNPFKNISDSKNIQSGNPNLTPEYSNAIELNYIKTWQRHILSLSAYFRNTTDVIQRIAYLDNDVMYNTHSNIAKTISSGAELVIKNNIGKFLNLTTTLNLYYYYLEGFDYEVPGVGYHVIGNSQKDVTWDARIMAQVMLPWGLVLQTTGGYRAPRAEAQGTTLANYSLDAGIRKSVGNFTFNLGARDILNSRAKNTIKIVDNFTQTDKRWRGGREMTLSVTYAFGNMRQNRQKERQQSENKEEKGYQLIEETVGITE